MLHTESNNLTPKTTSLKSIAKVGRGFQPWKKSPEPLESHLVISQPTKKNPLTYQGDQKIHQQSYSNSSSESCISLESTSDPSDGKITKQNLWKDQGDLEQHSYSDKSNDSCHSDHRPAKNLDGQLQQKQNLPTSTIHLTPTSTYLEQHSYSNRSNDSCYSDDKVEKNLDLVIIGVVY